MIQSGGIVSRRLIRLIDVRPAPIGRTPRVGYGAMTDVRPLLPLRLAAADYLWHR